MVTLFKSVTTTEMFLKNTLGDWVAGGSWSYIVLHLCSRNDQNAMWRDITRPDLAAWERLVTGIKKMQAQRHAPLLGSWPTLEMSCPVRASGIFLIRKTWR